MIDLRPAIYVVGLLVAALGAAMALPCALDLADGAGNWRAFALSGFLSVTAGLAAAAACRTRRSQGLSIQQAFALTVGVWVMLPLFGALPFMLGAPSASFADAYFEAMSGITTTGSTVFSGLETLPRGTLLWRGLLQWIGGIGIVVFALAFLPTLRVGGMQFFRSESFDTLGKILPRAGEIAASISWIYVALTGACALAYAADGMSAFDAIVHAMTTVSTGGFANYDASLGHFERNVEYIASVFMLLASLPFARYVQMLRGTARPLLTDPQARAYVAIIAALTLALTLYRLARFPDEAEESFREALFNTISIISGTGYASVDYTQWGAFSSALFFLMGLIGGCTGSTSCSIKIFRFQVVLIAISAQIKRIHTPHGVFPARYGERALEEEVISSVMAFFFLFFLTLGVLAVAMGMLGYDTVTAVSGAATALANIGPGLGDIIGPSGNFAPLSDSAKWLLAFAMLIGRLEVVSVYVLLTAAFWRR
ncbi:TrkH family potassium uptake protein [Oceanicella actignis]|uniref:Trk system potassium uptake protein n=1 Tax=Oceanicella actignis TaxID=1189325 RepID=A0A1M7TN94_9RHOB|nr:TrkH family potassium uptake protein [Oceanicella actignis]SET72317.1 trk system potassium uptake protein TrkH [Oceanicella actignis]SHN72207.1 trk system potassium uptake protein TrkH [Oceanicella actignis]